MMRVIVAIDVIRLHASGRRSRTMRRVSVASLHSDRPDTDSTALLLNGLHTTLVRYPAKRLLTNHTRRMPIDPVRRHTIAIRILSPDVDIHGSYRATHHTDGSRYFG